MQDEQELRENLQGKKRNDLRLSSTLANIDISRLNQYLSVGINSFNAQVISKSSRRVCVLKVLTHDYWFRLNQPVSVTTLMMETGEPSDFILRLLRKGVERGRYVRSGAAYLPSFKLADSMAGWFQRAAIPFVLQPNQFLIRTELPCWRFTADFMSLVGASSPEEKATGCVVILRLIALEITHDGPVTATLLSEETGFSKSTISNIVEHLLSVGYLTSQPHRFDERISLLSLTLPDDYREAIQSLFTRYFSTEIGYSY